MSMLYSKDYVWFTTTGECIPIGEWDALTVEEKPDDRIPANQLHHIFPEAKGAIQRAVKNDTRELNFILRRHKAIKDWWFLHIPNRVHLSLVQELALVCYGKMPRQEELERRIKKNKLVLNNFKYTGGQTKATIERAKAVPITDILEFDRAGFTRCIWHSEKHASMKYYPKANKVWCFPCNKGGDVIDVTQTVFNLSTAEAIKKLCK